MGWSPGAIPQLDWLSYLRSARTHNSHQAHWSLFLSCFKTWHSLWPLSRQTPSCHRVAARWRMRPSCRGLIAFTLTIVRVHLNAFVSEEVCFQLLQWGHSSKLTCHPGVQMSTDWEPSSTSSCRCNIKSLEYFFFFKMRNIYLPKAVQTCQKQANPNKRG